MLGLKQICVLLNKIDLVHYSEEKFVELKDQVTDFLKQLNIHPTFVLPISAIHGDNVAHPSEKLSWFDGPTVLQALDTFEELKIEEKPLTVSYPGYLHHGWEKDLGGKDRGRSHQEGESVYFSCPKRRKLMVKSIEKFLENDVDHLQILRNRLGSVSREGIG